MKNSKSPLGMVLRHGALGIMSLGNKAANNVICNEVPVPFSFQPFWIYEKEKPRILKRSLKLGEHADG